MKKMHKKFSAAILSLALIALGASCFAAGIYDNSENTTSNEIVPELQRELVIYETVYSLDLNPHTSAYVSEAQILNGVYEGLFSYNPVTLEPDYALAENYRISRDKLRWSFTIRENAKFSNGKSITAEDVKESWLELIANPGASYASFLDIIKGAADYRTGNGARTDVAIYAEGNKLSIELVKPASHLPKILCHHAFSVISDATNEKPGEVITSGPYYIKKLTPLELVLAKNEHYWDAENVHIPSVRIIFSRDAMQASHAFNTGAADWLSGLFDAKTILDKKALQFAAEYGTTYYFFKEQHNIWSSPDFRNALLSAVPWKELRAGAMFPATTIVCPSTGYKSPDGIDYTDISDAKLLLKQAKQKAGLKEDEALSVTFAIADNEYMQGQAELLKNAFAEIGVELKIVKTDESTYLGSIHQSTADIFSYSWVGDFSDPLAFLELFRGDSTMNESGWKNDEFDDLLDKAAFTTDESEHNALLSKAEDILLASGLVMPVMHAISSNAVDLKTVGGWTANSMDVHPYKYLFIRKQTRHLPNVVLK